MAGGIGRQAGVWRREGWEVVNKQKREIKSKHTQRPSQFDAQ